MIPAVISWLMVLPLFLLTGCEDSVVNPCHCIPSKNQPVLFQYRYVNHAWGYQDHGWLIDSSGNVRHFEYPSDFRTPDSNGYLSLEDLEHNLSQTDSLINSIGEKELERHVALIPEAAAGEIGERQQRAYDAGTSSLACYVYDSGQDAFRYVLLGMSGDWEQLNQSEEAADLLAWLRQFNVFWLNN